MEFFKRKREKTNEGLRGLKRTEKKEDERVNKKIQLMEEGKE